METGLSNLKKYNKVFCDTLSVGEDVISALRYQDVENWDSIGHMQLMAGREDAFEIEMDIDDIIDFSSYEVGKTILKKYDVAV